MRSRVLRIRKLLIAMLLIVVPIAISGWWYMLAHGKRPILVIVTVHELSLGDYGTVRIRYHIAMEGSPIVFRLGKRSGNSVFVYGETRKYPSTTDLIFGQRYGSEGEEEGSYELGECRRIQLFDPSGRIELKPGESYTLAMCTKANGERVELFVSCE